MNRDKYNEKDRDRNRDRGSDSDNRVKDKTVTRTGAVEDRGSESRYKRSAMTGAVTTTTTRKGTR